MPEEKQDPRKVVDEFRKISHNATWNKLFIIFVTLVLNIDQSSITNNPFTWKDLFSLIYIKFIVYADILINSVLFIINLPFDWIILNEHIAELFNYDPDELFNEFRYGKYKVHYAIISGFISGIFWTMVINAVNSLIK